MLIILYAVVFVLYAVLTILYAVIIVFYAVLTILYAVVFVLYAVLTVLYAVVFVLYAVLTILYTVLFDYMQCLQYYTMRYFIIYSAYCIIRCSVILYTVVSVLCP